ncbi:uncharacterized protein LOC119242963 [Talpa occidentalis]|uniref:uncharacterized protein LOC119242963 n=1 Tax=Talpa occidentalis TaxID=50954 RepID=UPI0023F840E8|nr:uncharacterized protein LOC119242963 [Talpa occidentalis]
MARREPVQARDPLDKGGTEVERERERERERSRLTAFPVTHGQKSSPWNMCVSAKDDIAGRSVAALDGTSVAAVPARVPDATPPRAPPFANSRLAPRWHFPDAAASQCHSLCDMKPALLSRRPSAPHGLHLRGLLRQSECSNPPHVVLCLPPQSSAQPRDQGSQGRGPSSPGGGGQTGGACRCLLPAPGHLHRSWRSGPLGPRPVHPSPPVTLCSEDGSRCPRPHPDGPRRGQRNRGRCKAQKAASSLLWQKGVSLSATYRAPCRRDHLGEATCPRSESNWLAGLLWPFDWSSQHRGGQVYVPFGLRLETEALTERREQPNTGGALAGPSRAFKTRPVAPVPAPPRVVGMLAAEPQSEGDPEEHWSKRDAAGALCREGALQ